jgi:hypothetical protein
MAADVDIQSRDQAATHPSCLPCGPTSGHQGTLLYGPSTAYERRYKTQNCATSCACDGTHARMCQEVRMYPITISHAVGSQNWGVNGAGRRVRGGYNIGRRIVSSTTSNQFFLGVGLLQNLTVGLCWSSGQAWPVKIHSTPGSHCCFNNDLSGFHNRRDPYCYISLSCSVANAYEGSRNTHLPPSS